MTSQSQNATILNHLRIYGSITHLQAENRYQCMRLAARICYLRGAGHDIKTNMIKCNKKRYASYELVRRGECG